MNFYNPEEVVSSCFVAAKLCDILMKKSVSASNSKSQNKYTSILHSILGQAPHQICQVMKKLW